MGNYPGGSNFPRGQMSGGKNPGGNHPGGDCRGAINWEAIFLGHNCPNISISLSHLLKHKYHVMHILLPDKHNVANHFCLQAFLSEQSFPSLPMSCSSAVIFLFFIRLGSC